MPRRPSIGYTSTFDNSEANVVNPNPDREVRWGDQSWDEMMIGFFDTIPTKRIPSAQKGTLSFDATGTYHWQGQIPGELSLSIRDDVLKRILSIREQEIPIEDAVMTKDHIVFSVRSPDLPGMTLEFDARVTDAAIRGKVNFTMEGIGRSLETPWVAEKTK